jgi:predicted nucleic acid-binding protein
MRALLDTSGWIEFFRPRGTQRVKELVATALRENLVVTAAAVLVELLVGLDETSPVDAAVIQRIKAVESLDAPWDACAASARIGRVLRKRGQRVPTVDLMLAGVARFHGCDVWHFKDSHFIMIEQAAGPRQLDLSR